MAGTILIVDDDPVQRRLLEAAVTKFGYGVVMAETAEKGLDELARPRGGAVEAILLDLVMPGIGGLDFLRRLAEEGRSHPVIVQTSQGSIETAVSAMRLGAFDFVVKPTPPERLRTALANATRVAGLAVRAKPPASAGGFADILVASPAMETALRLARKAAASDIPVLIEGETGVGKEVLARAIRSEGARAAAPFVTVNCGAIPEHLVESILFGHEKGAFTGATERHAGKFVEADGGTLFLDEIGELPLDAQVKLLRAVQTGEIDPVGARSSLKVDIRLVSATHRDLAAAVRAGTFREDLYYRLNVFPIVLPPLRERVGEIAPLTRRFIAETRESAVGGAHGISPAALALLEAYDWPGNIRQLHNAVFRANVLCEGDRLDVADFPQIVAQLGGATALPPDEGARPMIAGRIEALDGAGEMRQLADIEAQMIRMAIAHYGGRLSEVARRLGIGRSTLYRKLRELGIDQDAARP